jgi:predicted nicotinamide N-methyase
MANHLSVGVQTWGSAILLGRRMAKYPDQFGLLDSYGSKEGIRILELGAGTGLLSILCRKLLDLKAATDSTSSPRISNNGREKAGKGLIVATDFLPEVIDNLKTCVNLNFPSSETGTGIEIAKLDWTTFPTYMASHSQSSSENAETQEDGEEETSQFMDRPFDLILASDCVYDETHAKMLREVVSWTLRLPENGDEGGTFVCPPYILLLPAPSSIPSSPFSLPLSYSSPNPLSHE